MSKLATLKVMRFNRIVIQETLVSPSIEEDEAYSLEIFPESNWMSPILHFLQSDELLHDEREAKKIRRKDTKYTILSEKLREMEKATPMLRFLCDNHVSLVLVEIHKGTYNSHISRKALAQKLLREGYYWPTLMKNNIAFIKKCDKFQRHAHLHHTPVQFLQSITPHWPFY